MTMFTGCGTALVTPFRKDQSLDEETLRKLVRRQIQAGINFLVPCGTTGESPTLTRTEHLRVAEITIEESKGKVPVLAGAGGYNTTEVIELAKELAHMGADGILMNTAIAAARDPVAMAYAMRLAVEAGRTAFLAGRMPRREMADPSSPLDGMLDER